MDKKKYFMGIGAIIIVIFIGWFYIEQLSVPKSSTTKTMAEQVENKGEVNKENTVENESTLTRVDSQGSVTIQATLLPEKSHTNLLTFEIVMNTHSGDLLQYDIRDQAQLSFGTTINRTGTFEWKYTNKDSHHMSGYLMWKGNIDEDDINLELKNIENIPTRLFTWEKKDLIGITQLENGEE